MISNIFIFLDLNVFTLLSKFINKILRFEKFKTEINQNLKVVDKIFE